MVDTKEGFIRSLNGSSHVDLKPSKVADGERQSHYYMKKHRILDLLANITSALVYERPDDPKAFMIEYIDKLKMSQMAKVDYPSLFNESNVRSLFEMMDPATRGYINHTQFKSGMENLGVSSFDRNPPGSDVNQIDLDTFVSEAKDGIVEASATFAT